MKIAIGSDHAGYEHKIKIITYLENKKHQVLDVGTNSLESVDYPDFAHSVSEEVLLGADFGILICGSGNGIAMAANKTKGIRAAVCWNKEITLLSRQHNDANIISLPARFLSSEQCQTLVDYFLSESFEGGRHKKRINKI